MKKARAKRWLAGLLTVIMLIGMLPSSAFADEASNDEAKQTSTILENQEDANPVTESGQENPQDVTPVEENNQDEQETPENPEDSVPVEENQQETSENPEDKNPADENQQEDSAKTEESYDPSEEGYTEAAEEIPPEGYCTVMSLDGTNYSVPLPSTSEQVPIENIIKEDSNGRKQMYVTLRDKDNRIVSTTDPEAAVDSFYQNGATVALKQGMTVQLSFDSIKEAALPNGVSEKVYYYMDLPDELVPNAKDSEGRWLINPDEPLELFHNGKVRAFGGIYKQHESDPNEPYRLKFNFVNTDDQIELSGAFQYTVTIGEDLQYDTTYDAVDFGGAGQISFTTEKEPVVRKSDYALKIEGKWNATNSTSINDSSTDMKINWTVTLSDNSKAQNGNPAPSIDKTMTLNMKDKGHGFLWNNKYSDSFYSQCPLTVEVTYANGRKTQLKAQYIGYWAFFDSDKIGHDSYYGEHILEIANPTGHVDGMNFTNNYYGGYCLSDKLELTFRHIKSGVPSGPVEDIVEWKIGFSTQVYDNVGIGGNGYTMDAQLPGAYEDGSDLTAIGGLSRSYGTPEISAHAQTYYSTFGTLPETVTTYVDIYQKNQNGHRGYAGNYVSLEYAPNDLNQLGADYYVSAKSFAYENPIGPSSSSSNSPDYLFQKVTINGKNITWDRKGSTSGSNGMFGGGYEDLALQYQMKMLFSNGNSAWVYKSNETNHEGKYYWMAIDNDLYNKACGCAYGNGWWGYSDGYQTITGGYTRKPGTWKVYIFNAAGEDIHLEFDEHLGNFTGTDRDGGGSITNRVTLSTGFDNKTANPGWGHGKNKTTKLTAEYITGTHTEEYEDEDGNTQKRTVEDDSWILWDLMVDFTGYQTINNNNTSNPIYSDRYLYLYAKVPKGTSFANGPESYEATGCGAGLYYYNHSSDSWIPCGGPPTKVGSSSEWQEAGFNYSADSGSYDLYYWYIGNGYLNPGNYGYGPERKAHLAFITKADSQASSTDSSGVGTIPCEAVLHDFTGDLPGGNSGSSLLSLEARAKGAAPQHSLTKSVSLKVQNDQQDTDLHQTKMDWRLQSNTWLQSNNTYVNPSFLDGVWSVTDSMADSVVKNGETVIDGITPASFTTIETLRVNAAGPGPGISYTFTKDELEMAANAKDHKINYTKTYTDSYDHNKTKEIVVELTYYGNMQDGYKLRIKGLNQCAVVNVDYTTVLNDAALCTAIDPDALYDSYEVEMKNTVSKGWMNDTAAPVTESCKTSVAAALAIKKTAVRTLVEDAYLGRKGWDGFTDTYTIETRVGVSPTPYLHITDYISGYTSLEDWDSTSNTPAETRPEYLAAVAQSMKLDPDKLTIKVQTPADSAPVVVYENQAFTEEWKTSVLTMRADLEDSVTDQFPGALFYADLQKADGSYIPAGSVVTITYNAALDMDTKVDGDTTFRDSKYYPDGVLRITNNVHGVRAYKGLDQVPDQVVTTKKARSGFVDAERMELVCDAGAGSHGDYLNTKLLNKQLTKEANGHYEYLLVEKAEMDGKDDPVVHFDDLMFAFETKENLSKLVDSGMSEEEAAELLRQLDILLRENLAISDLQIRYEPGSAAPFAERTLVYEQKGVIKSETKKILSDSKTVTVAASNLANGFSVEMSPVDFGEEVAVSYGVDIDWDNFYEEAIQQKILAANGLALGSVKINPDLTNKVSDGDELMENSSASSVEVLNLLTEKKLVSNNTTNGVAKWQVKAFTGFSKGNSMVIEDTASVELPEGTDPVVAEAVKAAVSMDQIKLVLDGADPLTIYENGKVTDAAKEAGWKDENVSITVNGLSIKAKIANQEGDTLLGSGQTYLLTYQSVLDKDAYFVKLTESGVDVETASYTLKNTAVATRGSASSSADASTSQKPNFPLNANKTAKRSDEDTGKMEWSLSAGTGDAARKDFEIRDILTKNGTTEPILAQTSVTGMVITLQTGDKEAETIFDYAGKVDKRADYQMSIEKIEAIDGDAAGEFAFETKGVYGFRIRFGTAVPKGTTVKVNYTTSLDKQAYLEAGGTVNTVVELENTMHVSAANSADLTRKEDGTVSITEMMSKTGRKGSKSNGNDTVYWTIPIDLRTEYSIEQLKNADVSVIDDLDAALSYMNGSLKVYERVEKNGTIVRGYYPLSTNEYRLEQNGNRLTIHLLHPDQYPAVEIEFRTEVQASLTNLTNTAYLDVDGKSWEETSEPVPEVTAAGQSGFIVSMDVPEWTPEVLKNLDGMPYTKAGVFGFTLSEVNADGTAIDGAYTDTALNNEEGKAVFKNIRYPLPHDGEIHYYKIVETTCDETKYGKDTTEYLLSVELTKLSRAYKVTITDVNGGATANGITFQNSTLIDIAGTKVWNDADNQDGKRPDDVTIHLLADGIEIDSQVVSADAEGNWNWKFEDLPRTAAGILINYTVTETTVEGYTTEITGDAETGFTVTNSYTPGKTSLNVTKVWQDGNDQDGKRPDDITVKLLADGVETKKTLTLSEENHWSGSFTDLDEYKDGTKIVYTIEEVTVNGYTSSIAYQEDTSSVVITNTHTPELIHILGTKIWDDQNDQDKKRPDHIEVQLLANGKLVDTKVVTPDALDNWSWAFENMPKYKDGEEILYTVTETVVDGYATVITGDAENGFTVTNSYTPEKTSLNVTKVWQDGNDQDGKRPDDIIVKLLADGVETKKTLTLNEENHWSGSFTDLDANKAGTKIVYTIEEVTVDGYTSSIEYPANTSSVVITNTHTPELIHISGAKTWDDQDDKAGKRPESITIHLLADGAVIESRTVKKADEWKWSFDNLPKYRNGKEIQYAISEAAVPGYQSEVNGYNVTNKYVPSSNPGTDTDSPSGHTKTGDTNSPFIWLSLLLMSFGGMVLTYRKRKKKPNY